MQRLIPSNKVVIKVLSGGEFTCYGNTKQSLKSFLDYVIKGTETLQYLPLGKLIYKKEQAIYSYWYFHT